MRLSVKIILFLLLLQGTAWAATIRPYATRDGTIALLFEGEIEEGDDVQLRRMINNAAQNGQQVSFLVLNSWGGRVDVGYSLALSVRNSRLRTFVAEGETCASACFLLFAAGTERFAASNARVGVHSVSEKNGKETTSTKSVTVDMVRFLNGLGVPSPIIGLVVMAPPSEPRWLTPEELTYMGVNITPSKEDSEYLTIVSQLVEPQDARSTTPTSNDRKLARSLNDKGIQLIRKKRAVEAIPILMKAMKAYPFDAEILGNLGYALYLNGDYTKARDTLALALKLNPKRWASWNNLGLALSELGEIEWATECFINYFQYSTNKKIVTQQLHFWAGESTPSANLRRSANTAIQRLGI